MSDSHIFMIWGVSSYKLPQPRGISHDSCHVSAVFFLRILGTVVLYSWSLRGSVPGQVFGPHRKTSPAFEIWSVILYLIHSHDIHWYTVIFYHSDKDTDPHSVVNIDQLTAIWEMLLVTTLSFVWGHEINNMMSQCIYSPPQIKTGVSDDATGDPASSTSMCGPRKNSQIVIERKCSSRVFHDFYWIKILY